jgi:hypothetical protein
VEVKDFSRRGGPFAGVANGPWFSRTLRVMPRTCARYDQPSFSAAPNAAGTRAFASPACVKAKAKKQPLV